MFDIAKKVYKKLLASEIVNFSELIKSFKSEKPSLFHFVTCEEPPREYLNLTDKDIELFMKYNSLYNEKSVKREIKKFRQEGDIYYHNVYGDRWQLMEDNKIKRVALGF